LASGLSSREIDIFLSAVIAMVEPVESHFLWRPQLRDPGDEMALETAVNGQADSFPETDAYMRYFLGASLAENVALEAIHIIDPRADEIVNRLGHSGQYGAHFLDMLEPYDRCWHLN
jgi:hypothetical protein